MRVEFEDDDLRRIYIDDGFRLPWMGSDLLGHFRRKMAIIVAAHDERDLYALRSLRFEKLSGGRAGQHSIRLNDQWRLIIAFRMDTDGRVAVVAEVVDYH